MSEILSLPKGWFVLAPSEVFNQVSTSGKKIKTKDCLKIGKYPVIDQGQEYISGYLDDEEKVISIKSPIIMFGDHTKTIKWISKSFIPGADGTKLLNPIPQISSRFFYYQLRSYQLPDKGYARHFQYLDDQPFVVPAFDEQHQIAQRLDELLAQVDTIKARLDAIPAILKRFRQSVLSAAVSGKLTEEWRGHANYNEKDGYKIAADWSIQALKEICLKVQSGSTPKNNPFEQGGNIPFLKVYNIVDQKISFEYKPQFVTNEVHSLSLKRSIVVPYDILMNIVGPPLGKVAIVPDSYKEWNINQAITLFRVNVDLLDYKYLYYVLCEGKLVRDIMPETKGSVGQINISLSQCRDFKVPVPNIEEQNEIVRRVDQYFAFADQIKQRVHDAKVRVDKLTPSILAKAFRGELTADWRAEHPELISGDNSAEALLAKIQAAKAALDGKKTRK